MKYNLIGSENKNPYKVDNVFIQPDMSNYNSAGDLTGLNKPIDIGFYKQTYYTAGWRTEDLYAAYPLKASERFNPSINDEWIGITSFGNKLNADIIPDGCGIISITYDSYKGSNAVKKGLQASATDYQVSNIAARNNVKFTDGIYLLNKTTNNFTILGYPSWYPAQATAYKNGYVYSDNNRWPLFNVPTAYLNDIWYDNNVIVCPSAGSWNGFTAIDSEGYYKWGNDVYSFNYREPSLGVSGAITNKSFKWILNRGKNEIIICDKFEGHYRPLLSGTINNQYFDLSSVKNCFGFYTRVRTDNAWGSYFKSTNFCKNLQYKVYNCKISDMIDDEPDEYVVQKDQITHWEDFYLDRSQPVVKCRPGDTNLYKITDINYTQEDIDNLCEGASFSGDGYFVYKAIFDKETDEFYSGSTTATDLKYDVFLNASIIGNDFDPYLQTYCTPACLIRADKKYTYPLQTIFHSANANSAITNEVFSDSDWCYGHLSNIGLYTTSSYWFRTSSSPVVSAKWICYTVPNGRFKVDKTIDYAEWCEYFSAYIPVYRLYKTIYKTSENVNTYNDDAFMYYRKSIQGMGLPPWTGTSAYDLNKKLWIRDSEFYHTSSYYDALFG